MVAIGGIAIGVLLVAFLGRIALESSNLESAIDDALDGDDVEPIVDAVTAAPEDKQPTHWDYALGQLWQAYAREQAAELVMRAAEESDATILQYWIQQVIQVEPAIARDVFTDAFLAEHFEPDVAARCGKSGCCG